MAFSSEARKKSSINVTKDSDWWVYLLFGCKKGLRISVIRCFGFPQELARVSASHWGDAQFILSA